jgi:hypothetical protein
MRCLQLARRRVSVSCEGFVALVGHFTVIPLIICLTLNIPSGVLPGPQTVIFCDAVVTITTDVLLIFVCVRHQLKVNIM